MNPFIVRRGNGGTAASIAALQAQVDANEDVLAVNVVSYAGLLLAAGLQITHENGHTTLEHLQGSEANYLRFDFRSGSGKFSDLLALIPDLSEIKINDRDGAAQPSVVDDSTAIPEGDYLIWLSTDESTLNFEESGGGESPRILQWVSGVQVTSTNGNPIIPGQFYIELPNGQTWAAPAQAQETQWSTSGEKYEGSSTGTFTPDQDGDFVLIHKTSAVYSGTVFIVLGEAGAANAIVDTSGTADELTPTNLETRIVLRDLKKGTQYLVALSAGDSEQVDWCVVSPFYNIDEPKGNEYDHISINGDFDLTTHNSGAVGMITTSNSLGGDLVVTYGTILNPQTLTIAGDKTATFVRNAVSGWLPIVVNGQAICPAPDWSTTTQNVAPDDTAMVGVGDSGSISFDANVNLHTPGSEIGSTASAEGTFIAADGNPYPLRVSATRLWDNDEGTLTLTTVGGLNVSDRGGYRITCEVLPDKYGNVGPVSWKARLTSFGNESFVTADPEDTPLDYFSGGAVSYPFTWAGANNATRYVGWFNRQSVSFVMNGANNVGAGLTMIVSEGPSIGVPTCDLLDKIADRVVSLEKSSAYTAQYRGLILGGDYDFTLAPAPVTGNSYIDSAPTAIKAGTHFIASGDGQFILDPSANPFLVYPFKKGDTITVAEDAASWSVAKLNVNSALAPVGGLDTLSAKLHSVHIPSKGGITDLTNQGRGLNPIIGEVTYDADGDAVYGPGIRSLVNTDTNSASFTLYALVKYDNDRDTDTNVGVFGGTGTSSYIPLGSAVASAGEIIRVGGISNQNPVTIDGKTEFASRLEVRDALNTGEYVILKVEGLPSGMELTLGDHAANQGFDFIGSMRALLIVEGPVNDSDDIIINYALRNGIDPLKLSRVTALATDLIDTTVGPMNNSGSGTGPASIDVPEAIIITQACAITIEHSANVAAGAAYFTFGNAAGSENDGIGTVSQSNVRLTSAVASREFEVFVQPGTYYVRLGAGGGSSVLSSSIKITKRITGIVKQSQDDVVTTVSDLTAAAATLTQASGTAWQVTTDTNPATGEVFINECEYTQEGRLRYYNILFTIDYDDPVSFGVAGAAQVLFAALSGGYSLGGTAFEMPGNAFRKTGPNQITFNRDDDNNADNQLSGSFIVLMP